jgi:hypothetical protein
MGKSKRAGFALPAVLGILALTSLACVTVWRMQWVHQQLLHVQFRLMRNQQIAEGVLPLVVQDITGVGTTVSTTPDTTMSLRHFAGTDAQTHVFYPTTAQERDKLQLRLGSAMCQSGICAPKTLTNLSAEQWRSLLDQSQRVIASELPSSEVSAFFWVEVWLNASASEPAGTALIATASPFIYRITVLLQENASSLALKQHGSQANSVVLQAIWSRAFETAPSGQWHSWKLLA